MVDVVAYLGQGALLQISDGAVPTPTFTTIPNCGSFAGPGMTRDTVDVTTHSSPNRFREFISGLRDGGEVSCDINWLWDDDAQNSLEDAFDADEPATFRIVYPMTPLNEYDEFDGLVVDLTKAIPTDAQVTRSLTIKITGPVTRGSD